MIFADSENPVGLGIATLFRFYESFKSEGSVSRTREKIHRVWNILRTLEFAKSIDRPGKLICSITSRKKYQPVWVAAVRLFRSKYRLRELVSLLRQKKRKRKKRNSSITIIIYVYFKYTSFLPWKVEIKRGRLSKFLSHLVIFSTHRLVQVSDKSQSPGECKSRTETNAPRQGLVLRGAATGWDKGMDYVNAATLSEINFRRSLLSTAWPLPSIRGHLWKSLSNFLPYGRGKKRGKKKEKTSSVVAKTTTCARGCWSLEFQWKHAKWKAHS